MLQTSQEMETIRALVACRKAQGDQLDCTNGRQAISGLVQSLANC